MNNLQSMLFKTNYAKRKWKLFQEIIVLSVIFTILITFIMIFSFTQHTYSVAYKESNFDITIQGFSEEQIEVIDTLPFVETIFPTRILSSSIFADNKEILIDIYATNSMNGREISFFNDKVMYKKDDVLLSSAEANPIIIDKQIARVFGTDIGKSISLSFGEGYDVDFTVAGITEPLKNSVGYNPVLILWQGEQEQAFIKSFGEQPPYSLMFVKASDKEKAKDYFLNEYIPVQFQEEGHLSSEEEIYRYNLALNVEREEKLNGILNELRYTPPVVTLISILGFISFLLVLYREANKKLIAREKDYSILNALGVPRSMFISYYMMESIIMQIPVLIISALLVKYVIYDFVGNSYMPWYFFFNFLVGAFILQIVAVLINGLLLNKKMKKTQLAIQLAKE